ncbi:MAG: glycosyltransferase [Anaerolineales bacterium]|jgi:glycosyltransferase involved in cell wall biosynthesis
MRIGLLADTYKPHVSGITHYISLNKQVLESRGHEVFVFTFGDLDFPDDETNIIRSPGVPVADTGIHLGFRYASAARRLLETMDIAHVQHPFLSGRLALRYCRPKNIPIVFTNHTRYDLYAQAYLPMLPDVVGTSFLQAYLPSFCKEVDLVIAPSNGLKKVLRDLDVSTPIDVIPNGVDIGRFEEDIQPIPREELGVEKDEVLLVYSGRLGPEKNLTFLVRAFAGAQTAYPDTRLMLVGDGPERDNLEDLAARSGLQHKVVFSGMVDHDDVPRYLTAADAFVTASVTEVHPLSVIEALACGLPVVGIDSPGVGDTITDGENGFLCRNDLAAFTAKLTRLIADTQMRNDMSERARSSALEYDIQRTSLMVEERYLALVERPKSRDGRILRRLWNRLRGAA